MLASRLHGCRVRALVRRGPPRLAAATQFQRRQLCAPPPPPQQEFTDIPAANESWLHRWLPAAAVPYGQLARWDRPIGTWLLLWPCAWSTALAAPGGAPPDLALLALFGVGSFAMRGAGCTVNDLWDRDVDRQVERTKSRPLASGALGVPQALGFLGAQLTAGLAVLVCLPPYAVGLGLASTPLWVLYPLAKRVTDWPQAVLGLTFNWGALVGWAAVHGACHWPAVAPLYAGGVLWTLMYDTIYAHQDVADDEAAGVRSSARALGESARPALALFAAGCIGCVALAGTAGGAAAGAGGVPFGAGVGAAAAHLAWQVRTVDLRSRADCLRKFQANHHFGALVFAAIVVGKLAQRREEPEEEQERAAASEPGEPFQMAC